MRPAEFILAKRRGERHDKAALEEFLGGYLRGTVEDYQVSAWLMSVCFQGMEEAETAELTGIMAASGDMLDLSSLAHPVDKHSTGGVGDKTTLVLAPLLAEAGATVAKMSGRGLGHTGGTVDKLESIPGFQAELDDERFMAQAREIGIVVSGQSKEMAPLDGMLYALRDSTGTVESLPLIASSIMSKKLAGGAETIVLDVKVGSGAFMRTIEHARTLARAMVQIGRRQGRRMSAILSGMEQPLGFAVGNALEVDEAVATLRGHGPAELRELCLELASQLLLSAGLDGSRESLVHLLDSGLAAERFERWIEAQGGDVASLDRLELARDSEEIRAKRSGVVARLDALEIGRASGILGGGRSRKGEAIDHGVGVLLHHKLGDTVEVGEPILTLLHRNGRGLQEARQIATAAIDVADDGVAPPLILEKLSD